MQETRVKKPKGRTIAIVAGIGMGIGGVAIYALSRRGGGGGGNGEEPPETDDRFTYSSDLIVEPYGGPNDIRWEVSVTNIGSEAGTCHVKVYDRLRSHTGRWANFTLKSEQEATLQPGESHTFQGAHGRSGYTYQLMAKSEAGTILNPDQPLEFICGYCFESGQLVSFATQEELDNHIAIAHWQYAPMDPCHGFAVAGLSWPDHFLSETWVNPEREDMGRITHWRAEAFAGRPAEIGPIDDQDFDISGIKPVSGSGMVPVSEPLEFAMPSGWVSSGRDDGGVIPNTTVLKLSFGTDLGWGGWLDFSPWLQRIPDQAVITFECDQIRCSNWQIGE
jgi:hypothetical protein